MGKNASSDGFRGSSLMLLFFFFSGIWTGLYGLVALVAHRRNHNPVSWYILAMFFTPIVALILLLLTGKENNNSEEYKF